MSDGYNNYRTARVAELLADFRTLQYYIAAADCNPADMDDYYTEGWAQLRQCALDGQHILNCAADVTVPRANGGPDEQERAELMQVLLDAYARRHEGQKIYLRQQAAQRWIQWRDQILAGGRPHSGNQAQLDVVDQQLRTELATITDEVVYADLQNSDLTMGRWTAEDPSLRAVQRWVRTRRC
ncbi:hypothetical protein B0J18DRAFT_465138 [Chaetomium sp. MPI-SDFR-AT-0129]|uniref:Uncharacterized protein n=1 Tax=Dichotomopilus funicola TaxID=1934379 RepID=A0AAN6ZJY0_9PEZI|nr:hypothetical protein B0J18DRAFT_465138 [Chaetomium sp. MPI-SDFR-AT-0129]KAK4140603.1 hypothetical protein C8A04DRAFT_31857 [Dichotomopilus funicola]